MFSSAFPVTFDNSLLKKSILLIDIPQNYHYLKQCEKDSFNLMNWVPVSTSNPVGLLDSVYTRLCRSLLGKWEVLSHRQRTVGMRWTITLNLSIRYDALLCLILLPTSDSKLLKCCGYVEKDSDEIPIKEIFKVWTTVTKKKKEEAKGDKPKWHLT